MSKNQTSEASIQTKPASTEQNGWKFIGPTGFGSRALCIGIDPTDPQHVYCGSASSGLWRSTDGAENWNMMNTNYLVTGVGAVAFHPNRPEMIYVGTGEVYGYNQARKGFDVITTGGSYGIGILGNTDRGYKAEVKKAGKLPKQSHWKKSLDVKMATSISVNSADPDRMTPLKPPEGCANACTAYRLPGWVRPYLRDLPATPM